MGNASRNAAMMQVRMLVAMAVGLITSRVTLQQLGVEDYGAYSLVWGVLTLIVFANNTLCNASVRFLSVELAGADATSLRNTFAACKRAHLYAAIAILAVAETAGLAYMLFAANLPASRFAAVMVVYQISLVTVVATILQSPYTSLLIAHEKMDVYATIEIVNVTLKLLLVYLLIICDYDKLLTITVFYASLSAVIYFCYRYYCVRKYDEARHASLYDKTKCRTIIMFSATDLYGNACVSVRDNGFVMIINYFFGVVYNAVCNLATVANRALAGLAGYVLFAYKPQITMSYARNDFREMSVLVGRSTFGSVAIMGVATVVAISFMPSLLNFWLGVVPDNAVTFTNLLLITGMIETIFNPLVATIHASGKIKALSFLNGSLYLLTIPIIIGLFWCDLPAATAYLCIIAMDLIIWLSTIVIIKRVVPELRLQKYFEALVAAISISVALGFFIHLAIR